MISRFAVDQFLKQPRDNHVWIKGVADYLLDQEIAALRPQPLWLPPFKTHQKACFLLGIAYPELFFQLDMGVGKTLISLALIAYFIQIGKGSKFIAFVPMDEAIDSWLEEVEKWGFPYQVAALRGPSAEKVERWLDLEKGLALATYVGFAIALSDLLPDKKKPRKNTWTPNIGRIRQVGSELSGFVLDESTKVSHRDTLQYAIVKALSNHATIRFNLAGRPFGRDPVDLWAQFYLIDHGKTLGPTLGLYREALFTKKKQHFGGPYSFDYKLDKTKEDLFSQMIGHRSIHYSIDECADLPPIVRIIKRVGFPEDTETYYKSFVQKIIDSKGNLSAIQNTFLQMRQASSGFLSFKQHNEDEEDDGRVEIEFPVNPKFDMLMDLIEEIPEDQKAVIFYQFTYSGRKIHQQLLKEKYKAGWLWGGTKDWAQIKKQFDTNPNYRFLVIQVQKGSYALNLQAANIAFFYESPVSVIDREQAERRIWRQGQTRKVRIYDLVTRRSADEKILKFHAEGGSLFKALISDPARVFEEID